MRNGWLFPLLENFSRRGIKTSRAAATECPPSENKLQRELQNAGVPRCQSAGAADIALDLPEASAVQRRHRRTETGVIQKVERFRAQLKDSALSNGEHSRQRYVELENTWSFKIVAPEIAICARQRTAECGRVEPVIDGPVARVRAEARNEIRHLIG